MDKQQVVPDNVMKTARRGLFRNRHTMVGVMLCTVTVGLVVGFLVCALVYYSTTTNAGTTTILPTIMDYVMTTSANSSPNNCVVYCHGVCFGYCCTAFYPYCDKSCGFCCCHNISGTVF